MNPNGVLVGISIVAAASLIVGVLLYMGVRPPTRAKPHCALLHAGTATVEVSYPPSVVESAHDPDRIMFYKKGDLERDKNGDAMYVLGINDRAIGYETANEIVENAGKDGPGPVYDKKTTFNGLEAALATPSPDYYYYEIPVGNVVIDLEYIPHGLAPEERKLTDAMVKGITFKEVSESVKRARVENCY